MKNGGDVNEYKNDGNIYLIFVCIEGNILDVLDLLNNGVYVNLCFKIGESFFLIVFFNGYEDIV